jgi:hypothetical protein
MISSAPPLLSATLSLLEKTMEKLPHDFFTPVDGRVPFCLRCNMTQGLINQENFPHCQDYQQSVQEQLDAVYKNKILVIGGNRRVEIGSKCQLFAKTHDRKDTIVEIKEIVRPTHQYPVGLIKVRMNEGGKGSIPSYEGYLPSVIRAEWIDVSHL